MNRYDVLLERIMKIENRLDMHLLVDHEELVAEPEPPKEEVAEKPAPKKPEVKPPKEPEDPDYTCPICGGDHGFSCPHTRSDQIAAANRKIRELEECYQELQRCHAENYKNASLAAHREALESAAKMLEEYRGPLYFGANGFDATLNITTAGGWYADAAHLVRNHRVT